MEKLAVSQFIIAQDPDPTANFMYIAAISAQYWTEVNHITYKKVCLSGQIHTVLI